ncbi:MAG: hypothetical protein KF789_07535 [Bdellovibrionaceae bacterium]|nr:hypothetical protein [Pseudobdellovibrionaceae bacterium]
MKTITIILTIFFSQYCFAQSSIDDGRYINIYSGITSLSSNVSGSGFSSELPGKSGPMLGADVSYQFKDSSARVNFFYEHGSNSVNSPSGLTPSQITMSKNQYTLMVSFVPVDSGMFQNLRLGLGYSVLMQGGDDTSPNNISTMQSSQGLLLHASYEIKAGDSFIIQPGLGIYLPYQISEKSQVSGNNPKFMGTELKLTVDYLISDSFSIFAGVEYNRYQANFDGTGSRGTSSAQDVRTDLALPLGFKLGY